MWTKLLNIVRQEQGMSLIELIVAISIVVMMLGVTSIYLPNYRAHQLLKQAALDINDSLRYTQSLSISPRSNDTSYYMWELSANNYQVEIKDELGEVVKVITFDDENNPLMKIDSDVSELYFQAKTGKIFTDDTLNSVANGEIQVIHSHMSDEGQRYYGIEIYNNSFNLESKLIADSA